MGKKADGETSERSNRRRSGSSKMKKGREVARIKRTSCCRISMKERGARRLFWKKTGRSKRETRMRGWGTGRRSGTAIMQRVQKKG